MVNQLNNNNVPWLSTVPDQMPWLDPSANAAGVPMQFVGQQAYKPEQVPPDTVTCRPHTAIPHVSTCSPTMPSTSHGQPLNIAANSLHNPFYPQQAGCQLIGQLNLNVAGHLGTNQTSQVIPSSSISPISHQQQPGGLGNLGNTLTQIPHQPLLPSFEPSYQVSSQKRSSFEMEDDLTTIEAPPTKQQLSENKLFQRFGSLHLDNELRRDEPAATLDTEIVECDASDSDDEAHSAPQTSSSLAIGGNDRKEFDRYVYLLFKDKKSDGQFPTGTANAVERLIREEREKLSKAVILWNPPPNSFPTYEEDSSDDDQVFKYKDHRDFLKAPQSSVVITEVCEDTPILELDVEPSDEMSE